MSTLSKDQEPLEAQLGVGFTKQLFVGVIV